MQRGDEHAPHRPRPAARSPRTPAALGAADSTRKAEEDPNSPPAEKPWTSRASNRMSGAATPIAPYVGETRDDERRAGHQADGQGQPLLAAVPVGVGARARAPPIGRITKPTANTASVDSSAARRVALGEELRRRRPGRSVRVHGPVHPLDGVADGAGDDRLALLPGESGSG